MVYTLIPGKRSAMASISVIQQLNSQCLSSSLQSYTGISRAGTALNQNVLSLLNAGIQHFP